MSAPRFVEAFLEAAASAGWRLERRDGVRPLVLPHEVIERHGSPPASYAAFLSYVAGAASAGGRVWFLCERDFGPPAVPAFAWNEIEMMALASAGDDQERRRVVSYWDRHLPVMMAPDGDYDYVALVTRGVGEGAIVHGYAPEWEDPSHAADSFEGWLAMLTESLRDDAKAVADPLAVRVMRGRAP